MGRRAGAGGDYSGTGGLPLPHQPPHLVPIQSMLADADSVPQQDRNVEPMAAGKFGMLVHVDDLDLGQRQFPREFSEPGSEFLAQTAIRPREQPQPRSTIRDGRIRQWP